VALPPRYPPVVRREPLWRARWFQLTLASLAALGVLSLLASLPLNSARRRELRRYDQSLRSGTDLAGQVLSGGAGAPSGMLPEVARFRAGQIGAEEFAKEAEAWEEGLRRAYELASEARPPADLEQAHGMVLAALRLYQHAARVYRFASRAPDPLRGEMMLEADDLLGAAHELYGEGNARIEAALRRAGLLPPELALLPGG
jgi:hypothetical protein